MSMSIADGLNEVKKRSGYIYRYFLNSEILIIDTAKPGVRYTYDTLFAVNLANGLVFRIPTKSIDGLSQKWIDASLSL